MGKGLWQKNNVWADSLASYGSNTGNPNANKHVTTIPATKNIGVSLLTKDYYSLRNVNLMSAQPAVILQTCFKLLFYRGISLSPTILPKNRALTEKGIQCAPVV